MNAAAVLFALSLLTSAFPPRLQTHQGETEGAALARYHLIATAMADEARGDVALLVMMTSVMRHESALWRSVHAGELLGDRGKSRGLFQLYFARGQDEPVPRTDYVAHEIVGTDYASTRRAVHAAAIWMRPIVKSCRGWSRCLFMRYGGLTEHQMTPALEEEIATRRATWKRLRRVAATMAP